MIDMKKGLDHPDNKMTNEVIIYEGGNPMLKVEIGTTLKVVKLLYEAQYEKSKGYILGVKPKLYEEGIPCIVTLNDSKLNEISYDVLVSEDGEGKTTTNGTDKTDTNRCIDCSRESWKTKRFTNIGMNTEISINPLNEVDPASLASKEALVLQRPPLNQIDKHRNGSTSSSPTGAVNNKTSLYGMAHNDYLSPLQAIPQNGNQMKMEHHRSIEQSLSSPTHAHGIDAYSNHVSSNETRYPNRHPIDAMHYDHFASTHSWALSHSQYPHGSRSAHNRLSPAGRRSPNNLRSRSPHSPRSGDIREGYASQFHHRLRDKHLLMMHSPRQEHRIRRDKISQGQYDRYEDIAAPRHNKMFVEKEHEREIPPGLLDFRREDKHARPQQPAEEPPVFVLPNDYDVVSGIDPRVASIQERRFIKSPIIEREKEITKAKIEAIEPTVKTETQNYQRNTNGDASPKSSDGNLNSPESTTNSAQKLYCKICNSVFPTKSLLYKHLRGHTSDEKPFKCTECGQGFTLSSNLRQHRIIHRGYKPFQCEFCGKKFMRSNVYKQHRRIHTGEEMHKCGLCPSEFLQKYALLKHMKKNHDIDAVDN